MHLRDAARQAWADAGLYKRKDRALRELLDRFENDPAMCVSEIEALLNKKEFQSHREAIVAPLMALNDRLMNLVLIRRADVSKAPDVKLLKEFVSHADLEEHRFELSAVEALNNKPVNTLIRQKRRKLTKATASTAKKALNVKTMKATASTKKKARNVKTMKAGK